MRNRSEARREAILAAAAQEFSERGYEGASMSAIVARAGGSKQTLYNHFPSKDELFVEVMLDTIGPHMDAAYVELAEDGDLCRSLCRYGQRYLTIRQSPELIGLTRLAFGESGRSDIGRLLFQRGKMKGVANIAGFLAAAMGTGDLRPADPTVAAFHYYALLDAELLDPVVLRAREPAAEAEIAAIVGRSVEAFLAAYARR